MRIPGGILSTIFLVLPLWPVASQDLSTYVAPSEDEWREAFELGEISYAQYLCLSEIARNGIDSSSLYLLDEIPNLSYFEFTPTEATTPLEQDQKSPLAVDQARPEKSALVSGQFDYRYLQSFEDVGKSWYRSTSRLTFARHTSAVWKVNRESSGQERIVYRSVAYNSRNGLLRSAIVGNFTARFGLGTLFGYHGKLMSHSACIDNESFAYPDYGGYNGLYVRARTGNLESQILASIVRDETHRLVSLGAVVKDEKGGFRPGLIAGVNHLLDRRTRRKLVVPMSAVHHEYRYTDGYASVELARQFHGKGSSALVMEGRQKTGLVELRYAGWTYGRHFYDLTSGSKAGSLYEIMHLEKVDFECSAKRTGQCGALVKTAIPIIPELKCANALLVARRDRYHHTTQLSSALVRSLGKRGSIQIDYLLRYRSRLSGEVVDKDKRERWRLEGRINSGGFRVRSYIGYNTESERRDNLSFFTGIKMHLGTDGLFEIWSNMQRFSAERIEYWYLFARGEQNLMNNLRGRVKLAHTYRDRSGDRHSSTFSLGVVANL